MIKEEVHLCPACQAPAAMLSSLYTEIDVEICVRCNCIKIIGRAENQSGPTQNQVLEIA